MYTRKMFQPSGVGFGASVFDPGPMPSLKVIEALEEQPRIEETPETAMDAPNVLAAIGSLPAYSEELQKLKSELLALAEPLQQKIDDLVAKDRAERHGKLDEDLERARAEGRSQEKIVTQAEREYWTAENQFVESENARRLANLKLREHRERQPRRFASKSERAAHDGKEKELIKICGEVDRDHVAALRDRNRAAAEFEVEKQKLANIGQRVEALEGQISGRPFRDPEFGLMVPEQV